MLNLLFIVKIKMPFRRIDHYDIRYGLDEYFHYDKFNVRHDRYRFSGVDLDGVHYVIDQDEWLAEIGNRDGDEQHDPSRIYRLVSYNEGTRVAVVTDVKDKGLIFKVMTILESKKDESPVPST